MDDEMKDERMSKEKLKPYQDAPAVKATIIEQAVTDMLGREAGLSVASRLCLVIGVVGLLASILAVIVTRGGFIWFAAGFLCLFAGVTLFILFGALSEIIRLLKALAGLPYDGAISGNSRGTIHTCSACGALAWQSSSVCKKCGAQFEKPEPEAGNEKLEG
jgi:hypothetical protein